MARKTSGNISLPVALDVGSIEPAKKLGSRFPPGYPEKVYEYHVRYSDIWLGCHDFKYRPQMNMTEIEALLRRLMNVFIDPVKRDIAVEEKKWYEPPIPWTGKLVASVAYRKLPRIEGPAITYGTFLNVVIGINHIQLEYPHLTFACVVVQGGPEPVEKKYLGLAKLEYGYWYPPRRADG
ncbi:MAG: hypothetical protein Q9209_007269 [Squamulea sp. 1 TL-2023]